MIGRVHTGARDNNNTSSKMDACTAVAREIEKVLTKFTSYSDHAAGTITALHANLEGLQHEIHQGAAQCLVVPSPCPPPRPSRTYLWDYIAFIWVLYQHGLIVLVTFPWSSFYFSLEFVFPSFTFFF